MIKYKQWLKNKGHWTQQDAYKSEKMDEILKFNHSSESYWQDFPVVLLFIILKGVGWISILIIKIKRVAKKTTSLKLEDFWSKHF